MNWSKISDDPSAASDWLPGDRRARHLLYWIGYAMFFGLFWGSAQGQYGVMIISEFVLLPTKMVAVYALLYGLIPRLLLRRRYLLFAFLAAITVVAMATVQRWVAFHYLSPWKAFDVGLAVFNVQEIMHQVINIDTALVVPIGMNLARVWFRQQLNAGDLERGRLEMELRFLKHQLQPHFLFNTLNTLYGLILSKSDQATKVVLTLSELMRYALYESSADRVPLQKEIDHIQNFISLEQRRFSNRLSVAFSVKGDTENLSIAPMIVLHFVENSLKHSLAGLRDDEKAVIDFGINIEDNELQMHLRNSKPGASGTNGADKSQGIGWENVQRQLDLIYPGRHSVHIDDKRDTYQVKLSIELEGQH